MTYGGNSNGRTHCNSVDTAGCAEYISNILKNTICKYILLPTSLPTLGRKAVDRVIGAEFALWVDTVNLQGDA